MNAIKSSTCYLGVDWQIVMMMKLKPMIVEEQAFVNTAKDQQIIHMNL